MEIAGDADVAVRHRRVCRVADTANEAGEFRARRAQVPVVVASGQKPPLAAVLTCPDRVERCTLAGDAHVCALQGPGGEPNATASGANPGGC